MILVAAVRIKLKHNFISISNCFHYSLAMLVLLFLRSCLMPLLLLSLAAFFLDFFPFVYFDTVKLSYW